MADPKPKPGCLIHTQDVRSSAGRDPFAKPGSPGNRWLQYGCDAEIPAEYLPKLEKAVMLAYDLAYQGKFVGSFAKLVSAVAKKQATASAYLDSLNAMTLNFAEKSTNPIVAKELADESNATKIDATYLQPGGFTKGTTGQLWIREFVLKNWNQKQVAGLLAHEATHIAGAPGDMITEFFLASLFLTIPDFAAPQK